MMHRLEALGLRFLFGLFAALPLDVSSFAGGFIARSVGPFMRAHRIARNNLAMIFPDMPDAEKRRILTGMWDNLGRVAGELPHLPGPKLTSRIKVTGEENLATPGTAVMFISAHFGNWELAPSLAFRRGISISLAYRQANNMEVDAIIAKLRATQTNGMFPKGTVGAVRMIRAIKNGNSLAMLVDQKMNDGIPVPFFGREAMTAPAAAQLAVRNNMPIIPARVRRTHGAHFEATIYPPMQYTKTGDEKKDVLTLMTDINSMLESWIRDYPDQWFWVHKRWPESKG